MKTRTLMWISAIALSLPAIPAAADTWGLNLSVGRTNGQSAAIDDPLKMYSFRFTAKDTIMVDTAHLQMTIPSAGNPTWEMAV